MKIDKVVWSSSEEYSDFWNINSYLHNKYLNMDCVLLLFGKKEGCDLSEEFGEVIEMDWSESLPFVPQLAMSKFMYPRIDPDATWLIGDIDQLPLQREHFVDNLEEVPDDHYVHLAEDAITSLNRVPTNSWRDEVGGTRCNERQRKGFLTAHYHAAKGSTLKKAFGSLEDKTNVDHVKSMMEMYYEQPFEKIRHENDSVLWAFEEQYTTSLIRKNISVDEFTGFSRPHGCDNPESRKVDRGNGCKFDKNRPELYVDFHCPRPYKKNRNQIDEILNFFWEQKND